MKRKLLVAYSMTSTHVQTTLDYLRALKSELGYDATYLHVTHEAVIDFDFNAAGYDIVFHNYCSRLCFDGYVSQSYLDALKRFSGLKVIAVQDEYDDTNRLKAAIKECGFQIVLTCVPQDSLEYVYPRAEFPGVEFITVFTGYVPDDYAESLPQPTPLAERPIVLGYRGRDIGPRYGRLGFEKYEIGRRMKEVCDTQGVVNDIAMDEASRIYGSAWFDFVGRCRAMLGSGSGSNVFDFDGRVAAELKRMQKRLGRTPTHAEFQPIVGRLDTEITMGQISPRIFECAVMRTPMVLFRGRYSDAIAPDEHYIPLELDFSNADQVLHRLRNLQALEAMAERAYTHLVASGEFGYRAYFGRLKVKFEAALARLGSQCVSASREPNKVASGRQVHRMQWPMDEPGGMDRFNASQLLATQASASQLQMLAAMRNAMDAIEMLQRHKASQMQESASGAGECPAGAAAITAMQTVAALQAEHNKFMQDCDAFEQERARFSHAVHEATARSASDEIRALGKLALFEQGWIARFSHSYQRFFEDFNRCRKLLQQEILTTRVNEKALPAQLRQLRTRTVIARAFIKGSQHDLVKIAVQHIPFARDAAVVGLRLMGRLQAPRG